MARTDLDMTEGNIWKHMLHFSIPMAIGLLFQQLYNTVDTLVVGQFVGQNWGAKKAGRARKGVRTATVMSLVSTAALGLIVFLLARPLMGFFSPEAEVIDYGIRFIRIVTPFYIAVCFNQIYAGALRGIGDATMPTVIMLGSFVAFRQVYLAVTKALGAGFVAVALAYPVGWILCSTLLLIRYRCSALVRQAGQPGA